jgi:hypothetical protein
LSSFVDPYERFVMLLKSRTRTHHTYMPYSYIGVGVKTCLSSRSTQKCCTSTLGVNTKICLLDFSSTRKEAWAMQKLFIKKEKIKKELRKNGQVSEISKIMGT